MLALLTFLVVGLIVLGYASIRFVRALSILSFHARLPKFFLSFVLIGLGTSLPDLFVAGFSSSHGNLPLIVGMVIGANVVLLSLVLGIVVFIKGRFQIHEKTILENFGWIFFVLMIPFFLLVDGRLTFFEGIVLVIVYLMYVYNVTKQEPFFKARGIQTEFAPSGELVVKRGKHGFAFEAVKALAFLAVVLVAAQFVVENAVALSRLLKVPEMLVGLSVVALGVSLPELALDLSALRVREQEIVWGDLIGSFITELTLVLGVAALFASPAGGVFDFEQALVAYAFMAVSFLLVFFFAYSKKQLTKAQGIALMLLYVIFLSLQIDLMLFRGIR